jgi:hypothetical protein
MRLLLSLVQTICAWRFSVGVTAAPGFEAYSFAIIPELLMK